MEYDYTCLNRNLLMSPKKKNDHQGCEYKAGLLYYNILLLVEIHFQLIATNAIVHIRKCKFVTKFC